MNETAQAFLRAVGSIYIQYGQTSSELKKFMFERKLSKKAANVLGLGFAPKGNVIYEYAKANKFTDIAFQLGMIKSRNNQYYDLFQDRVMIPIKNLDGECIGFSGRSISSGQIAKYLNMPESSFFKKEEQLFGVDGAKESIKKQNAVILVEGYMDTITLYDQGITNTVSLGGYQLTDAQIDKLKILTHNFYIMMDNDQAGKLACRNICKQLSVKGLNAYVLGISPFKDPYELMNSIEDQQSYMQRLINEAELFPCS